MREVCGCIQLENLITCPPVGTGNRDEDAAMHESLEEGYRDFQGRWGCPAAGKVPPENLPRDLMHLDEHAAKLMKTKPCGTCPFACVQQPDPWVWELTHAVATQSEYGTPMEESLGRSLTAVDLQALRALRGAQSNAYRSDREIAKQEREAEERQRQEIGRNNPHGYR